MPNGPGMPGGMRGPPLPGAPGGMPALPKKSALFIENGAENSAKEYAPGQYQSAIQSANDGIRINGLALNSGAFTFDGLVVTGEKSVVTLSKARMHLGVTQDAAASDQGGAAVSTGNGATLYINDSILTVDGAQRYVVNNGDNSKLIVNDSRVTQTGGNAFTAKQTEPFSNNALFISGIARANMSTGTSRTYYFNSTVSTDGWASLSTDSASKPGLDLYAYNTTAIARHGGYGTYADFDCRVWLYGSRIRSAEVGAIISKSGQITIADGGSAPADVLKFNHGKTTSAGSVVTAGRNVVMIHAPDMMGEGRGAADSGTLNVINSTLVTDDHLKSSRDYAEHISKAAGAYVDYVRGADLLIKSTSATISFDHAKLESFSHVLVLTVLNSDRMGNFLKSESDGAAVRPIAISMKDMNVSGDVRHMDYQRVMNLVLDHTTLNGAVLSGSVADWNRLWAGFERKDTLWVQNDVWSTFYGVRVTLKRGSSWTVSAPSLISSLTLEQGASLKGRVQVDGTTITPTPGTTYSGRISVNPL